MTQRLHCADKALDLNTPQVMGVLNVTPDSFSDGGLFLDQEKALQQARLMVQEGASIIDIGGESTRPGATSVSEQEELDRVIPIIELLRRELPTIVSIDTSKAAVMREAVAAGAGLINDVAALRGEGCMAVAAQLNVPVCLMHMQGEPGTMQHQPQYENVVQEVKQFLEQRIAACIAAGMSRDKLLIDPGFGFGKSTQHNLSLVKHLHEFHSLACPILVGFSRKSTIGALLSANDIPRPADQRLFGSLALASIAQWQGASIFRVHDVAATADVLKVGRALLQSP
ncbi:MAG: dihydropteroate synthase [Gammaproteobacteria bacterium]|nr:dihydropteroate synthase [Gammaproteobacteria bacterium]MDH5800467.1 dihydropteroate synthase [Gammaproteobacteria bacterium]